MQKTIFEKNFARNYEKKILGTSDAWLMSRLSQQPNILYILKISGFQYSYFFPEDFSFLSTYPRFWFFFLSSKKTCLLHASSHKELYNYVSGKGVLELFWTTYKVIHTKYSKHPPYTVAHTIECVCSKINHGLNHGLFISPLKLINCPIHWIVYE